MIWSGYWLNANCEMLFAVANLGSHPTLFPTHLPTTRTPTACCHETNSSVLKNKETAMLPLGGGDGKPPSRRAKA